jgi:prolyl-tRNA synthetase
VGRAISSVIEQSHDQYGPIWPMSIAPYHVHITALNLNQGDVKDAAFRLYSDLMNEGLEVLFDDRNTKAGSAFSDADLIGIPVRLIVSPKTLAENVVEFQTRDRTIHERYLVGEAVQRVVEFVRTEMEKWR